MRLPLVMTMSHPAPMAMPAAESLVAMPPVPRQEPAPPAISRIWGVSSRTWWMSRASGWERGSAS